MRGDGDLCGDRVGSRALSERLKVVAVAGDRMQLLADRAAGCSCCTMRRTCGAAEIASQARPKFIEVALPEGVTVRAGDEVDISLPAGRFLATVGLAYLLPTLAVVITAGAGLALKLPDLWVALLCLPALGLALVPLGRAGRRSGLAEAFRIEAVHSAVAAAPAFTRCGP
ncbi:SoxR reducing system RseC family protein [Rhodobacter sp. NSM]|uniref:SoxR reducing system RseC family protein n=1 Tax=Rhodobacter sp. NSM TaxID=3457501 RepID=UPI003FD3835C